MKIFKFLIAGVTALFIMLSSNNFHIPVEAKIETDIDVVGQTPITFVLVHGAWGDSSYWDKTANELKQMGHKVYTPNLPGHGKKYKQGCKPL